MSRWTEVLTNVAVAELVLLAVLTVTQWARHRIRGAGWVALAFIVLGGLSLALRINPGLASEQDASKLLLASLLLAPYCMFRFAATFRTPTPGVRVVAFLLTAGMIAFTFALPEIPEHGAAGPASFTAYRISFVVVSVLLFGYVAVRLLVGSRGQPAVAAWRMRLLAVGLVGLEVPVAVAALRGHGAAVDLALRAVAVAAGVLLLVALVVPAFVRVFSGRREDVDFRQAMGQLVAAGSSKEVCDRLLPRVCAMVGASEAALLAADGTVVAREPLWTDSEHPDVWAGDGGRRTRGRCLAVRAPSGASHVLAVEISPFMSFFGRDELRQLDQLADMVGLAIERCDMAEQLAFQASHDGLTGLANRTLFLDRLEEALTHVGRRRSSLAVLFIDLDRFKLVNDRVDHTAGDQLLNEVASRLMAMTRGTDVVARLGGDEFVAFAEVEHEADARDMAERIRKGLGAPVTIGEVRMVVTASIGVVVTTDGATTSAALLRDADNAMYEAKRGGRDQVVLFTRSARDAANRRWGLTGVPTSRLSAG